MDLVLVSVFLTAILGVRGQITDPTAVCYPPSFQANYFNMLTEDNGYIYVDFSKEKYAELSTVTGDRFLYDFTTLKSYAIAGKGNSTICKSADLRPSQVMYRCLPPYAKMVSNATGYLHHVAGYKLYAETFEMKTEFDTMTRVTLSYGLVSTTNIIFDPILSHKYGYHGTTELLMYNNHISPLAATTMLTVPDVCDTN